MRRALRPDSWRRAAWTQADLSRLAVMITAAPVVRGLDYLVPPNRVTALEAAAPLAVWTAVLWAAVAVLTIGAWQRRHALVWLGHGLLAVLYGVITIVVGFDAAATYDGWRGMLPVATVAFAHATFAIRTGPRPITQPVPAESVAVEGAADA